MALNDQTAESERIIDAIYKQWVMQNGCLLFLLTDQGSNVDGEVVHNMCEKLCFVKAHGDLN